MTEEDMQPPTNIKEIGIHMFYLKRDVSELKDLMKESAKNSVNREEFDDYKIEQAAKMLAMQKQIDKKPWAALVLGGAFSALLTSLLIYMVTDLIK